MRRRLLIGFGAAVAAAGLGGACSNDEPGIVVSVDLAEFAQDTRTLNIAIAAMANGFRAKTRTRVEGVDVWTEDTDGDGTLELIAQFLNPGGSVSFRVATDNAGPLTVSGHAVGFDDTKIIAGADGGDTALPGGGRTEIALKLTARTAGIVGPTTRTTDVKTAPADVTVKTAAAARFSSVAVCNVDGDDKPDLVIGAPGAANVTLSSVGAVYVLRGAGGLGSEIDPTNPNSVMEFHFFGREAADRLGAAVACADLNADGIDDLVVGAPGAAGGAGRVYAVFGGRNLPGRTINPGTAGAGAPDVTWETAAASAGFGSLLFAAQLDGGSNAEILAATAPAAGKVHLLKNVTATTATPINVDAADHVTFSNVHPTSIAAGDLARAGGADVVIGDADAKLPNTTASRGAIYGFASVPVAGTTQYDATSTDGALKPSTIMYGDVNAQFGAAVLALDTTGNGPDLIVGAPGAADGTGAFYVYERDDQFFTLPLRDYTDYKKTIAGPFPGGRFGAALAGTPSGTAPNFSWDLLVGAPATRRNDARPLAGAAYLFGGGAGWPFPLYEQMFGAATGDQLGSVVAGGQLKPGGVPDDSIGDLVTIAPNAATDANTGIVYVRLGRGRP
jgi:hypothetical protein